MTSTPFTSFEPVDGPRRYVVLGSRGKTGGRVAQRLRVLGHEVVEASRSTAQRFDWTDPGTWEPTLAGAFGLYATYFPDLAAPGATDVVGALAERARAAGIERAALLSGRGEPAARAGEKAFLTGLPGADVLRCAWFNQNYTEGVFASALAAGVLSLPAPATAVEPFVDAEDIADCAIRVLTGAAALGGVHELTGPAAIAMETVAATFAQVTGRPVEYRPVTIPEFAGQLEDFGLPPADATELAHAFAETFDGRSAAPSTGVSDLLGRPATSFADFALAARDAGRLPAPAAAGRVG